MHWNRLRFCLVDILQSIRKMRHFGHFWANLLTYLDAPDGPFVLHYLCSTVPIPVIVSMIQCSQKYLPFDVQVFTPVSRTPSPPQFQLPSRSSVSSLSSTRLSDFNPHLIHLTQSVSAAF